MGKKACVFCGRKLGTIMPVNHSICGFCLPVDGLPAWWKRLTGIEVKSRVSNRYYRYETKSHIFVTKSARPPVRYKPGVRKESTTA